MSLPTGLLPVLVFVLTVGVSVPVTLGAHLFHSRSDGAFRGALSAAVLEAGCLYLVGVVVIWTIAGGPGRWEVPATLLLAGVAGLVALLAIPLRIGRSLVARIGDVDAETGLRYATYGWPIAMLAVFGIFVVPGARGHLLHLESPQICLGGFCGIGAGLLGAALLAGAVAAFGPGIAGAAVYSAAARAGNADA